MRPLWQMQFSNSWPQFAVFQIFLLRICSTLKTYAFQNSELVTQWTFWQDGILVNTTKHVHKRRIGSEFESFVGQFSVGKMA